MYRVNFWTRWCATCLASLTIFSAVPTYAAPGDQGEPVEATEELVPSCPRPTAFLHAPNLQGYVDEVCRTIGGMLDHRTGAGNGAVARYLEKISISEVNRAGLTYDALKRFILETAPNGRAVIQVVAYRKAIDRTNKWLADSAMDFFQVVQHPIAEVLEAHRNLVALFPEKKGVTQDDVKAASDRAYPDNRGSEIRLPIHPKDLETSAMKRKYSRYLLVGDPNVPAAGAEPLPRSTDPLEHEKWWYRWVQRARFAITLAVMGTATYYGGQELAAQNPEAGSFLGVNGLTPEAAAVFSGGVVLEAQFIALSNLWRRFWVSWGFTGNVLVNLSYGAILASVKHLVEYAQGAEITFERDKFLIGTAILGATFIASFGGMQVASARMKEEGELSEGGAMALESIGNVVNNFGRFFATTALAAGAGAAVGHLGPWSFGQNELVGWAIQGFFFLAVTAPLWLKRLYGDKARTDLIAYNLLGRNDPTDSYNAGWLATPRRWCAKAIAFGTRLVTPRRIWGTGQGK